ncbi:hypothetical protein A2875_05220 [Candidatus Gottesmanbacteria bacterium RIFCSPHIGHO2_01_FULL_46_14]|uniref:BrnT family toxin n=3 Tax=Candidatus Gottesmaniibacteriota TaxID=1752720 RepID=A0A1F5ZQJ6_9BACT|nr:MAG: hypothetical protein UY08_C0007G0002 [Candidatus Gottesmanbacteria bacterium GW2011_GWA1_47_8]OGG14729.1 MAG: hypothetical protein A2875_05220 [Candidatus Gottesmanbacteria bacterium RIFCSPHIGHO2_01_FULL_46_14]OGG29699.1 MAG: hypothetical protein A2971_00480 [Candidatus Gottesmanbacteria bacterium RIFCSPLOWO2_01_FULL_46_21]
MDVDLSLIEGFDWDKGNLEHITRHKVNYKECEEVFLNKPFIVNEDESHSQSEERFRVYGHTNKNRLVMLVLTIRNNKFRIISVRDQSKKERKEYQEFGDEYS